MGKKWYEVIPKDYEWHFVYLEIKSIVSGQSEGKSITSKYDDDIEFSHIHSQEHLMRAGRTKKICFVHPMTISNAELKHRAECQSKMLQYDLWQWRNKKNHAYLMVTMETMIKHYKGLYCY